MRRRSHHGLPGKQTGIMRIQSLENAKKHLNSGRQDHINCHFKCVGVCTHSRNVMKGFGSCSYLPDGCWCVCERERKKEREDSTRQRGMLVNALYLGTRMKVCVLTDSSGFGNADATFRLWFVSQRGGRLGRGEKSSPSLSSRLHLWQR